MEERAFILSNSIDMGDMTTIFYDSTSL